MIHNVQSISEQDLFAKGTAMLLHHIFRDTVLKDTNHLYILLQMLKLNVQLIKNDNE